MLAYNHVELSTLSSLTKPVAVGRTCHFIANLFENNINRNMHFYSYIFAVVFAVFLIHTVSSEQDKTIASARIESCPGCSLNRLPQVKAFIYEDIPKYDNVEFKKIHGAVPELVLLNAADEEIERLPLSKLNRKECNELMVSKGFSHKTEDKTNAEL